MSCIFFFFIWNALWFVYDLLRVPQARETCIAICYPLETKFLLLMCVFIFSTSSWSNIFFRRHSKNWPLNIGNYLIVTALKTGFTVIFIFYFSLLKSVCKAVMNFAAEDSDQTSKPAGLNQYKTDTLKKACQTMRW